MNQLFTLDRDDFRTTLEIVCRHLVSIHDLLALEEVSELCCVVVRAHQHTACEVTLRCPRDANLLTDKQEFAYRTRESSSFRGSSFDTNVWTCRGPIITRLRIILDVCSAELADPAIDWCLDFIKQRAEHLKQLTLDLNTSSDCQQLDADQLNTTAAAHLMSGTQMSVIFTQCTRLKIQYMRSVMMSPYNLLMPTLLRHFPAVEHLTLEGQHLPLLSHLPAPERLKKLEINIFYMNHYKFKSMEPSIAVNFERLQSLSLINGLATREHEDEAEGATAHRVNPYTRLTRIRFIGSLNAAHLANNLTLQEIKLTSLSRWTVALLSSEAVARSIRVLHLQGLYSAQNLIQDLAHRLTGGQFSELTHLRIVDNSTERILCQFLRLTPSLEELEVGGYTFDDPNGTDDRCDLQFPLHSLTRLTVHNSMRDDWLASVKRNASPDGLKVVQYQYID